MANRKGLASIVSELRAERTNLVNELRHQLGQDFVLGLYLLLQELNPFLFLLRLAARTFRRLEGGRSVLEELFLPAVEHGGLQPQFLTQIGNRDVL